MFLNAKMLMLQKKRAQISLMIVLGMMILFVVVLLLSLQDSTQSNSFDSNLQNSQFENIEKQPLQEYIASCVKDVALDGIVAIAAHGGYLFTDVGGFIEPNASIPRIKLSNGYITYGIIRQTFDNNSFYLPPPYYPFKEDYVSSQQGWPYYGKKVLPPLCIPEGVNNITINSLNTSLILCKEYGPNSIQEQLQYYINNNLLTCIQSFENVLPYNVTNANVTSTVFFGRDDITLSVDSDFEVYSGGSLFYIPDSMKTKLDIRFKKLYDFVYDLIFYERYDLFFEIDKSYINWTTGRQSPYDTSFSVSKSCPLCPLNIFDNVITVTDSQSLVRGIPLQFKFIIQNRYPVLDWMHVTPRNESSLDYQLSEGTELLLKPIIYDPDEEKVFIVNYSGWQQDTLTKFVESCPCEDFTSCSPKDFAFSCQQPLYFGIGNEPKNLTNSVNYSNTRKDANIPLYRSDLGYHKIRVKVTDRGGLSDWQDVSLLVTDLPFADLSSSGNIYPNIPNDIASIEDPFIFNASLSNYMSGNSENLFYEWSKDSSSPEIYNDTGLPLFPYSTYDKAFNSPYNWNIETIHDRGFTTPGRYDISLAVNGVTSDNSLLSIQVGECFKSLHGSELSSLMYPYNVSNPYFSKRTCCVDDPLNPLNPYLGVYASTSTMCHQFTPHFGNLIELSRMSTYGLNLRNDLVVRPGEDNIVVAPTQLLNLVPYKYQNDLFKLELVRFCSGYRGNICNGDAQRVFTLIAEAKDDVMPYGKLERCQGYIGDSLTYFDYDTFESHYGLDAIGMPLCYFGSGQCSTPDPLDNPESGFGNGGVYSCSRATCLDGYCDVPLAENCFCNRNCGSDKLCEGLRPDLITDYSSTTFFGRSGEYYLLFQLFGNGDSSFVGKDLCDSSNYIKICTSSCSEDTLDLFMSDNLNFHEGEINIDIQNIPGCHADDECGLRRKGYQDPSGYKTQGCNGTGIFKYCFPYNFDSGSATCLNSATSQYDCAINDVFLDTYSDYSVVYNDTQDACLVCDNVNGMEVDPSIVSYPPPTVQTYQIDNYNTPHPGRCSSQCGSDPICDGKYPNQIIDEYYGMCNDQCKFECLSSYTMGASKYVVTKIGSDPFTQCTVCETDLNNLVSSRPVISSYSLQPSLIGQCYSGCDFGSLAVDTNYCESKPPGYAYDSIYGQCSNQCQIECQPYFEVTESGIDHQYYITQIGNNPSTMCNVCETDLLNPANSAPIISSNYALQYWYRGRCNSGCNIYPGVADFPVCTNQKALSRSSSDYCDLSCEFVSV